MIWRIVTSDKMTATPEQVRGWDFLDVLDAHLVLDMHQTAEVRSARRLQAQTRRNR